MPFQLSRREFARLSLMSALARPRWLSAGSEQNKRNPSEWVNPYIGASTSTELGEGKTFPGPTLPFGMVQLGAGHDHRRGQRPRIFMGAYDH
jgi:putative alpha-1,2-mannosidase